MSVSTNITLSVIMPVYNASRHLRAAIESILNQSFGDFELVIINDGSVDDSEEIILSYSDKRILYVRNAVNLGLVSTLNKAIDLCRGKFIARMDADDISRSDRFEKQIHFLNTYPEFVLIASVAEVIDSKGLVLGNWQTDASSMDEGLLYNTLAKTNCIVHPSVMLRAEVLKKLKYRHEIHAAEDYDLWLRMRARGYRLAKLPESLIQYRIHSSSIMAGSKSASDSNLRVAKQKWTFIRYALSHGLINVFILRVIYSTIRSMAAYFKSRILHLLRSCKYLLSISAMSALRELNLLKKEIRNFEPEYVFFFPYTHMGGAERVHADIVAVFQKKKCLVIFTGFSKDISFLNKFEHTHTRLLNIPAALYSPITRKKGRRVLLEKINADPKIKLFGSNSEYYLRLLPDVSKDIFCADLIHAFKLQPGENLAHIRLLPFAKRLNKRVFIAHSAMQDFKELLRNNLYGYEFTDRLAYIGNATDVPLQIPKKNDLFRILFVGRDSDEKRFHLFLDVARQFIDRTDILFEVAGFFKSIQASNVHFHGELDQLSMDELYNKSHMLLVTSSREGFPMVIMEAMAHGVIPICTPVGDIPYHLTGSNGVVLSTSVDEMKIVDELKAAIIHLTSDSSAMQLTSLEAYRYAAKNFSRVSFEANYRNLLGIRE